MNLNGIFIQHEIPADIRKKIERGTDFLFPKIYSSSFKTQSETKSKKINSDKELYKPRTNKNNLSHITNVDFYTANPKDIINTKLKSLQTKDAFIQQKVNEISQWKRSNFDKKRLTDIDPELKQTQRPIEFVTTFVARKSQNITDQKDFLTNQNTHQAKKTFGNYFILKELGHGGFAKVYEVAQKETNVRYAMKEYNLTEALECYQKEAKVGQFFFKDGSIKTEFSQFQGKSLFKFQGAGSIIKFIEKIKNNKKGCIIQEIGGVNFSKLISEIKGAFHNKQRVYEVKFLPFYEKMKNKQFFTSVITQICQGIKLMNQTGFVHCDLKLENILVDDVDNQLKPFPTVKIIDFGSTFQISKGLPKITITPEYMPPQLLMQFDKNGCQGPPLIYEKIDVWSIGCILLQIFTGVPLWFRYKCKICTNDKNKIELGIFSLTNRDYSKIIKKQQQLCDSLIKSIGFVSHVWQKYRSLLKEIFVMNPVKRISIQDLIQKLHDLK